MSKKRSCRRTVEENQIHEKAVRLRKMTDTQLIQYIEDCVKQAKQEGYRYGKTEGENINFHTFLSGMEHLPGIGAATIDKIRAYAVTLGYLN